MRSMTRSKDAPGRERGATMPFVAIMLVAVVSCAALAIDLGSGWRTRRSLIPATDATALAAVQNYIETGVQLANCTTVDGVDYLKSNVTNATLVGDCLWGGNSTQGYVLVTAQDDAPTWFAGLIRPGPLTVQTSSAAVYGPPSGVSGLRPIGLCVDEDSTGSLRQVIQGNVPVGTIIRIYYDKDQPSPCSPDGSSNGNWGLIDFANSRNSTDQLEDWVESGYDGVVYFENDGHTCTSYNPAEHCYETYPGDRFGAPLLQEFQVLAGLDHFYLPVIDYYADSGAQAAVHIAAIVKVRLTDYQLQGSNAGPNAGAYIEFELLDGLVSGTCCGSGGNTSNTKVVAMCATDPNDLTACTP